MSFEDIDYRAAATDADGGADGSVFDACAHCGDSFETGVRYPVTTLRGPDGTLTVLSFCDDACQRSWEPGD